MTWQANATDTMKHTVEERVESTPSSPPLLMVYVGLSGECFLLNNEGAQGQLSWGEGTCADGIPMRWSARCECLVAAQALEA